MYLIPECTGRGVKLGSESFSGSRSGSGSVVRKSYLVILNLVANLFVNLIVNLVVNLIVNLVVVVILVVHLEFKKQTEHVYQN